MSHHFDQVADAIEFISARNTDEFWLNAVLSGT